MDAIVEQALKKWPNVPDCFGWLGLDARGQWWMRDDRAQAAGVFGANRSSKGARLEHTNLCAFIGRNYLSDSQGGWFFQNGPQRVWVELEVTPWIWRTEKEGLLRSHTGVVSKALACITDEAGRLYVQTPIGFGLVHSQDMYEAAEYLINRLWPQPQERKASTLATHYGFICSPLAHYKH